MSKIRVLVIYLSMLIILGFVSCSEGTTNINPSPTDVVFVKDVNAFITQNDRMSGIEATMNEMDPVAMPHNKHEKAGIKCVICHHKEGNDDRIKQCAVCHKGAAGEDTIHNLCINCHAQAKEGPTLCNQCHIAKSK